MQNEWRIAPENDDLLLYQSGYCFNWRYRAAPNASTKAEVLHRLKGIVESTAESLGDFPERRIGTGTDGKWLDLGPPLVSASEGEGPYDVCGFIFKIMDSK